MVGKINLMNLKDRFLKMDFYDFDLSEIKNNKNPIILTFDGSYCELRSIDYKYGHDRDEIEIKELLLIRLFKSIICDFEEKEILIFNYGNKWINDTKKAKQLNRLLKEKRINNNIRAIEVEKEAFIVELLIKSCLKFNSFVDFVFEKSELIITLTDHMDMIIVYNNYDIIEKVTEEVEKINKEKENKIFSLSI